MKTEDRDTTIEDIHQIRREIAAQFDGDLFAITADARRRMMKLEGSDRPEKSSTQSVRERGDDAAGGSKSASDGA